MADHYIFELQFKGFLDDELGLGDRTKSLITRPINGGSMTDFQKFREDLSKNFPEPLRLQFIDDDQDIISIDSEEDFQEFIKFAKQRAFRSMLIQLILSANTQQSDFDNDNETTATDVGVKEDIVVDVANKIQNEILLQKIKSQIKNELREEFLSQMAATRESCDHEVMLRYEEDSKGNWVPIDVIRRDLPIYQQKKFDKKEMKLDSKMEKLAMKKKKAYERFVSSSSSKPTNCTTTMDKLKYEMVPEDMIIHTVDQGPRIMSGITENETCFLAKKVPLGKLVTHFWQIINDGTVNWRQVELRHTWSTPGLVPSAMVIPCPPLVTGEVRDVPITFRAPMTVGKFMSYWHLYYLEDNQFTFGRGQWLQFGHYICINGQTKPPKNGPEATGAIPKLKESSKEPKKTNVLNTEAGPSKKVQDIEEYKILNKECSMMCAQKMEANQKRLEATLASAEIAAEMARVAANAALRAALGKQNSASGASSPSPSASVNVDSSVGVGALNLPSPLTAVNITLPAADDNISSPDENKKDAEMAPKLIVLDDDSAIDVNINEEDSEDSEFVLVGMSGSEATNKPMLHGSVSIAGKTDDEMAAALEGNDECVEIQYNLPGQKSNIVEAVEDTPNIQLSEQDKNEAEILQASSQAPLSLSYPQVDPNINYPVYPPHMPTPYTGYPSIYPVFPAPNAQPHPVPSAKPEFPLFNCHPPVQYPQLPTYPPMSFPPRPRQIFTSPLVQHVNMETSKDAQVHVKSTESFPRPIMLTNEAIPSVKTSEIKGAKNPPVMANNPKVLCYIPVATIPDANKSRHATLGEDKSQPNAKTVTLQDMVKASNAKPQDSTASPPDNNTTQNVRQSEQVSVPGMEKKGESGIQILPQTLVDGAINVGATIYNTACNALNHLHLKDGESIEFDPVFENNMATLIEMGFSNVERNARLLKRYKNDINQVIGIICTTPGGNSLEID